jgi:RimJ/RimL family protein N-acetyltransferase
MIELQLWSENDLSLLERLLGDPEMTKHIGGPETHEQLLKRHRRYVGIVEANSNVARVYKVTKNSEAAGWVGYWEMSWQDQPAYEIGWSVLPAYQGQGVAGKATFEALAKARSERKHRFIHAFPSITNAPSNAICKKLGFSLIEECDVEYPPGHFMRGNNWRFDLFENA